ncbi:MAG: 8-amino-7-oxononanoate synthase [Novosphingobium sp.]|nr:8-amino-7-oxononanoate synthase [Novosphingobium sp.]
MTALEERLQASLGKIAARGQRRLIVAADMSGNGRIYRHSRELLDFSSNDYLGLARHPALVERSREWAGRYGAGSGASRLVTGTSEAHLAIEDRIARFKGTEAALLFNSGWQANASVLPALVAAAPGTAVFTDRLIHASLHTGCAAARVRQHRFRHNDLDHLADLLEEHGAGAPARIIVSESVFSMDGDVGDLQGLKDIARRHDAFLFVDEAHATGVLGPAGAGLAAGVDGGVDLAMGTFSKALGSFGAYIAGSRVLCDYLVNTCSGFIYSTALPPAVLGAIDAALDIVPGLDAERSKLAKLGDDLRAGLAKAGYPVTASSTHIVPAIVGGAGAAVDLSARLEGQGMLAAAIRPPTVPEGTSRLRFALRAAHDIADVEALLEAIGPCP